MLAMAARAAVCSATRLGERPEGREEDEAMVVCGGGEVFGCTSAEKEGSEVQVPSDGDGFTKTFLR
jgi:hypothetical protein